HDLANGLEPAGNTVTRGDLLRTPVDRCPSGSPGRDLTTPLRGSPLSREGGGHAGRGSQGHGAGSRPPAPAAAPAGEPRLVAGLRSQGHGGAAGVSRGATAAAGDSRRRADDLASSRAGLSHSEDDGLRARAEGGRHDGGGGEGHRAGAGARAAAAGPAREGGTGGG